MTSDSLAFLTRFSDWNKDRETWRQDGWVAVFVVLSEPPQEGPLTALLECFDISCFYAHLRSFTFIQQEALPVCVLELSLNYSLLQGWSRAANSVNSAGF